MITAIVRFRLPESVTYEDAKALFEGSAPKYRAADGLIRKYYLFGEDRTAGGVYLWASRAFADQLYTETWKNAIADKFGSPPEISYFSTPVIVDNLSEEVITEAA